MDTEILSYQELTKREQSVIKKRLLNTLNEMEKDQAAEEGREPLYYTEKDELYKAELSVLKTQRFERWTDAFGNPQIGPFYG